MRSPVRSPLLRKYLRVLLALVGGTLMLSGLAELYFSYRQAQRAIVDVEQAHATAAAARIEQFLNEVQEQVSDTTRTASDDPSAGPLGRGWYPSNSIQKVARPCVRHRRSVA